MKNSNFLEHVVYHASLTEGNSYLAICSADLKFQFTGNKLCQLLGQGPKETLDKNLYELDTPLNHLCNNYKNLNEKVLLASGYTTNEYFSIIPQPNNTLVVHNRVIPIINAETDEKVGIYLKTTEVNAIKAISVLKKLDQLTINQAIILNDLLQPQKINLTEKEEFILYLLAIGKYDKEIANLLHLVTGIELTKDAITKIVTRKLYPKFNVFTRSELVLSAYEAGYVKKLPRLMSKNLLKVVSRL